MCLSPITIVNPSKYVSIKYRDRYLIQVPCNECAECQQKKSQEWLFRTFIEFKDCVSSGGFVMFDTLTYDEEHLPHLDEFAKGLPHVPCFRSEDLTKFLKRVRINLDRKFSGVRLRYFISSEYGSKFGRPHYHLLLFVYGKISPLNLSRLISSSWKLGRTDGIPFKNGGYVMLHNVISSSRTCDILSASHYVTKYVQKDCYLQDVLNRRIKYCDILISTDTVPFVKSNSVAASRLKQKIKSEVNQFHLQSLGFGGSELANIDLIGLAKNGYLTMPSKECVISKVAIPMYYKRKLLYNLCEVDNTKTWQLNEDGKKFVRERYSTLYKLVCDRFECISHLLHLDIDCSALADYVLNFRGRFRADAESVDLIDRLNNITHYSYCTRTDKENVGIGVSLDFIGNSVLGYLPLINFIPLKKFIEENVYFNPIYEKQLEQLYNGVKDIDHGKQSYFALVQKLSSLYSNKLGVI